MARRSYAGAAVTTTLSGPIAASGGGAVVIASAAGWPDGSGGKFAVVVNRGESNAEKILVTSRTGTTLNFDVSGRGYDGSSLSSHSSGETIGLVVTAVDLDEANEHVNTAAVHLGTGTVQASHIAAAAVTAGKIAVGGVSTASQLADGIVTEAKLGSGSVTEAKIGGLAVTEGKIGNAAVTEGKIASDAVSAPKIASNAVTTAKILDGNVTNAKLANGAIANDAKLASGLRFPVVCTAATRPGSPSNGDPILETDTLEMFVRQSGLWLRPWRLPWGRVWYNVQSSDITSIGTGGTQIAAFDAPFNAVAYRRYKITVTGRISAASTALTAYVTLRDGSTDYAITGYSLASGGQTSFTLVRHINLTASGARDIKVIVSTDTGTVTFTAGTTYPGEIVIEDIGPAGLSAASLSPSGSTL